MSTLDTVVVFLSFLLVFTPFLYHITAFPFLLDDLLPTDAFEEKDQKPLPPRPSANLRGGGGGSSEDDIRAYRRHPGAQRPHGPAWESDMDETASIAERPEFRRYWARYAPWLEWRRRPRGDDDGEGVGRDEGRRRTRRQRERRQRNRRMEEWES